MEAQTPDGVHVIMLDNGAKITCEDEAMLQAMYSRDPASVKEHLEKVTKTGSGKFMDMFYVGYGHKSIGDCGSVTLFIEGCSMLAAKAIQDWQLYSGQEVSTRYVDFSKQKFMDPLETGIGEKLREFYVKWLPVMEKYIADRNPKPENEKPIVYQKAIKAAAFDVMRGFLPAGATTSLAWHANLRQTADKLMYLRHHPLKEVREIAIAMQKVLSHGAPHSFNQKTYPETEKYILRWMCREYYFNPTWNPDSDCLLKSSNIDIAIYNEYKELLEKRPTKTEIPALVNQCGTLTFEFLLDYGSYRDLQRHRSLIQTMPRLGMKYGFEQWYFDQLPNEMLPAAHELLAKIEKILTDPEFDNIYNQYSIPMGYRVPMRISGGLASMIYFAELRSGITVHATLRKKAIAIGQKIQQVCPGVILLDLDLSEDRFNTKRGTQDITVRS